MALPDPDRSRAILIGASEFSSLPALPAVRNNLAALAESLCDKAIWGLARQHCTVVDNPHSARELVDPVSEAAEQATDTLLVYYAGHGLVDPWDSHLSLALVGSTPDRPHTTTPYEWVRRELLNSGAHRRVVILDCCYSARALGTMSDPIAELADTADAEGTYLLAAASENRPALAPPGEIFTAFTAELLAVCRDGIPGGPELIDLDTLYRHIRRSLRAKARPEPQKRDRNTAGTLTLLRNRAWKQPPARPRASATPPAEATGPVTVPLPTPAGGSLAEMRPCATTGRPVRVAARYELLRSLAHDQLSDVHLAWDLALDRRVAVRLLHTGWASWPSSVQQFQRDAALAAELHHPSILAIHDAGVEAVGNSAVPYVVVEHFEGESLRQRLRGGPLSTREALRIVDSVLDGLEFGHQYGIIHGQVRPSRILLGADGAVKLANFGLGPWLTNDGGGEVVHTGVNWRYAPPCLSPEKVRGRSTDARSDIYSIGWILYETLTGHSPFPVENGLVDYSGAAPAYPPPARYADPGMSALTQEALDTIVHTAMRKDPARRYRDAIDMRNEINVLAGLLEEPHGYGVLPSVLEPRFTQTRFGYAVQPVDRAVAALRAGLSQGIWTGPARAFAANPGLLRAHRFVADLRGYDRAAVRAWQRLAASTLEHHLGAAAGPGTRAEPSPHGQRQK